MGLTGYKAFNKDLTNRYGRKFEVNKSYVTEGKISFGNNGNGFHFCRNIEDTLRYFDGVEDEVVIAEVIASGNMAVHEDEYNGYYDMYSAENIKIQRIIEREELVRMFLTTITSDQRVSRFIQLFKLTDEEIELFKLRYEGSIAILEAIAYYQENKKDVYEKRFNVKKR